MTREDFDNLKCGDHVIHTKHNREYAVLSKDTTMMKDSALGWIYCVVYSPCYYNENGPFCREVESFIREFEVKKTILKKDELNDMIQKGEI